MKRTYINQIENNLGEEITIAGYVQAIRDQGGIKFLILRDITGSVQIVVLKSEKEVFEAISDLTLESVVKITGKAKEEKQAPGGYEVQAFSMQVLSKADPELPIPVVYEKSGDETEITKRLDYRWIDLRRPEHANIFKIWTYMEQGFRNYLINNNFIQVYAPSFMTSPSESGSEVFEVAYFDRKAYLAQSPQFYKQMSIASGLDRVFMTGPVYRAEPSFTTRHLTEFTGWDFEMSHINSHQEVMDHVENSIVSALKYTQDNVSDSSSFDVPKDSFVRISMEEAKKKLAEAGVPSKASYDVSPEEERQLCELIKNETGSEFVFLTDWPIEGRPFYHMRYEDNPNITKSFDLLYRGIEIATGAQREHRYDVLLDQAKEKGMDIEQLDGYLNFFKYGCPPHGGVGIGPARIIMQMLNLNSVKEATFLPRDVKRLKP